MYAKNALLSRFLVDWELIIWFIFGFSLTLFIQRQRILYMCLQFIEQYIRKTQFQSIPSFKKKAKEQRLVGLITFTQKLGIFDFFERFIKLRTYISINIKQTFDTVFGRASLNYWCNSRKLCSNWLTTDDVFLSCRTLFWTHS